MTTTHQQVLHKVDRTQFTSEHRKKSISQNSTSCKHRTLDVFVDDAWAATSNE